MLNRRERGKEKIKQVELGENWCEEQLFIKNEQEEPGEPTLATQLSRTFTFYM